MQNNYLSESKLLASVKALGSTSPKDIQNLSLLECALMLSALPRIDWLSELRGRLAERIGEQLSTSWVNGGDALEVYSALNALWGYDPTRVEGEWLACAVQRLVRSEVVVGGPYRTEDNGEVATAANLQIAIFAKQVAEPLPNMLSFALDIIADGHFQDARLSSLGVLYLLSGVCDDQGLLEPAFASVGVQHEGLWDGEPVVRGVSVRDSSRLVTTALIAGMLCGRLHDPAKAASELFTEKRQIVVEAASSIFDNQPEPLRSSALAVVRRIREADSNFEITLLPQFFADALETPRHLSDQYCVDLGVANLCTWVAYTIYDDFIDDEGVPAELPVANVAMRVSLRCFRLVLPDNEKYQQYVTDVYAGMDAANAWEVDNCRFAVRDGMIVVAKLPCYGRGAVLAERAFAHALTPMAILALDLLNDPKGILHIESAFKNYLIARQLNDDVRDWEDDIKAGQISYVVCAIFRDMRIGRGTYDLSILLPAMRRCFWRVTAKKMCKHMLRYVALSRRHFAQSQLLRTSNDIYTLLDALESSARHSMDKCTKAKAICGYSNNP